MKRYLTLLLSLLFVLPLPAQSRREALLEYQARRRQAYTEFRDNYRKACADFMRKRWEAFRAEAPVPVPERREPDIPVTKHPDAPSVPTQDRMPYDKVVDLPEPAPEMPDAPGIAETPVLPGKPAAGKGAGDNGVQQGRKPVAGTDDADPAVDVSYRWLRNTASTSPRCRRTAWPMPGKVFREVHTMPWRRSAWR